MYAKLLNVHYFADGNRVQGRWKNGTPVGAFTEYTSKGRLVDKKTGVDFINERIMPEIVL